MNDELARKVADAVLYEGYLLYPYRSSALKNRQRWSFGILYPPAYAEVRSGTERCLMRSECLLETTRDTSVHVEVRFLHRGTRKVQRPGGPESRRGSIAAEGAARETADDGVARSVHCDLTDLRNPFESRFSFPRLDARELMSDGAFVTRSQRDVRGKITAQPVNVSDKVKKLRIAVENTTELPSHPGDRDAALLRSMLSTHAILSVQYGEFVSLLDPPEHLRAAALQCRNIGNFPVLIGENGTRDMMLCSPILLYDYPQIAPESAGDFFDATEMDEMLTLRVTALTESEKEAMRMAGAQARDLLDRTERSVRQQLARTHGVIRSIRRLEEP